jgi:hypothetical protein
MDLYSANSFNESKLEHKSSDENNEEKLSGFILFMVLTNNYG